MQHTANLRDWELAVTGIADMQDEIKRLRKLSADLSTIEERRNEPGRPLREYLSDGSFP